MTPYAFFLLTLGVTAAAVVANLIHRRQRRRGLAELARQWRMHYSPRDVLRLAEQVAPRLPVPGAADVSVVDVIYGIEGEFHRYIFSVEFTLGVVQAKQRVVRVVSFREPKRRGEAAPPCELELAAPESPLLSQYQQLHERHNEGVAAANVSPANGDRVSMS